MNAIRRDGAGGVLFVSHQASRTGAAQVLLHFLRWARRHAEMSFHVLLLRPGPLEPEFRALGPVTVLTDVPFAMGLLLVERELVKRRLQPVSAGIRQAFRFHLRHLRDFRAAYLSSVYSIPALRFLPRRPRTVITHVHELSGGMEAALARDALASMPEADRRDPFRSTDLFIAAAESVKNDLVARGVVAERVRRHYPFIDVNRALAAPDRSAKVREDLGLCPSTRVVVGSGTIDWRQGVDVFVHVARTLLGRRPDRDVCFVWVGESPTDNHEAEAWLLHDVRELGLDGRVRVVADAPNPRDYYRLADVFLSTSREDAFPHVCLEASVLGKPVVSFETGAMSDFLADGAGFIVPYLDIGAMARTVGELLDDPSRGRYAAAIAAAHVRNRFDVSVGAPALFEDVARATATA